MLSVNVIAQDVEIGTPVDNSNLVMNNGVIILDDKNDSIPGAMKFEGGVFYGFDGSNWVRLSPEVPKEIIGLSTATTIGRMIYNGKVGIEAANEMCKDAYPDIPTAKMYLPHEIDEALRNDLVSGITDGDRFWAFVHDFNGFSNFNSDTRTGNCWCFSFGQDDIARGVTGQIFINTITPGPGGVFANQVNYSNFNSCTQELPVICGK